MPDPVLYCGVPRSATEWAALQKLAGGDTNLSRNELRRMFMLGLVERQLGRLCLTKHGREMLALYVRSRPNDADRGVGADEQLPLFRDAAT